MLWIIIGAIISYAVVMFALCKTAGDSDRDIERLFQEEIIIHK